jgi:hypothetical protein
VTNKHIAGELLRIAKQLLADSIKIPSTAKRLMKEYDLELVGRGVGKKFFMVLQTSADPSVGIFGGEFAVYAPNKGQYEVYYDDLDDVEKALAEQAEMPLSQVRRDMSKIIEDIAHFGGMKEVRRIR